MTTAMDSHEKIKDYYGKVLSGTKDLQTSACCSAEGYSGRLREILATIAPEILDRFYGCGSPIPPALEGCTVLDLGCGTGRDVYLCSALVGETGKVIGVDMTPEQLEVARRHQAAQAKAFGFAKSNVEFLQGTMEDLASLGIEDDSIDVVLSNCVLNLSPEKERVFSEMVRVLKPGGEIYFADVFADRRLPKEWAEDPVLLGECLAGAMYTEDFRRLMSRLGIPDVRTVSSRPIVIANPEIAKKVGAAQFSSVTVRGFKLDSLEDRCEDFGQSVVYRGSILGLAEAFVLDNHHDIPTGKAFPVCGNTAAMLSETRFAQHFEVRGDRSVHYGLFGGGDFGQGVCCTTEGPRAGGCC